MNYEILEKTLFVRKNLVGALEKLKWKLGAGSNLVKVVLPKFKKVYLS